MAFASCCAGCSGEVVGRGGRGEVVGCSGECGIRSHAEAQRRRGCAEIKLKVRSTNLIKKNKIIATRSSLLESRLKKSLCVSATLREIFQERMSKADSNEDENDRID